MKKSHQMVSLQTSLLLGGYSGLGEFLLWASDAERRVADFLCSFSIISMLAFCRYLYITYAMAGPLAKVKKPLWVQTH